ncbi:MAG: uroporphyrinogen decarboxylase family protein [Candidatus Latescibacterota bacterium]
MVKGKRSLKSDLRLFLEDELDAVAESAAALQAEACAFWGHPEKPELAIWSDLPVLAEIPEPGDGTVSERQLYDRLMRNVRPALAARDYGFLSAPIIFPHDKYYSGPPFGTRFLAAAMGAEISFPKNTNPRAWDAFAKPLIQDVSEIEKLEAIDVAQSPVLQAILSGLQDFSEIVQGRIPFTRYIPTYALDFAADVVGHLNLYEWVAERPEDAARLVDVCLSKWLEIMDLQEAAAGSKLVNQQFVPGIRIYDMIGSFFSPESTRKVVLPYNRKLAAHCGCCVADIVHQDQGLLDDFLHLPDLRGLVVPADWPMERVVAGLRGRALFRPNYAYHVHRGQKQMAPICVPWEDCCRQVADIGGQLRVLATVTGLGDTPRERMDDALRDREDLMRAWEGSAR